MHRAENAKFKLNWRDGLTVKTEYYFFTAAGRWLKRVHTSTAFGDVLSGALLLFVLLLGAWEATL